MTSTARAAVLAAVVTTAVLAGWLQGRRLPGPARSGFESPFTIVEATISDMQRAMERGRVTSREIVQESLTRIALYEDRLNAVIAVNPRALAEADERDRERAAGVIRGPLHGIPIALKDNIHTTFMPTTGGALAFAELVPTYEATVTRHLRESGAIIIAKTQMTELANWVTVDMPANYNSLTGYGLNPYDPRRDPRAGVSDGRPALPTGGSSSGAGTAASFWAANVGTETSGSILSPSNQNMLVGIKPTVGRVSRHGIIPITADQDTAGPMTRSVSDAAIVLGALEGASADPSDPATARCSRPPGQDYTRFLDAGALDGARIGVPRAFFYDRVTAPGSGEPSGGLTDEQRKVMEEAIRVLKERGATIVDPANVPSVVDADPQKNLLRFNICAGHAAGKNKDADCSTVLKYGMKRDFDKWLALLGDAAPVRSLTALREWNRAHRDAGALKYGQENLDISDEMDVERDRERYDADRKRDLFLAATHGIDEVMLTQKLDALLFPGATGAGVAARPGYPTVIVPFGFVSNVPAVTFPFVILSNAALQPFPQGFDPAPAPFGVSFTGRACTEPRLIALAYAFEQATRRRTGPPLFP
jgi:amidase